MHLANALLRELENPGLSLNERAVLACRLAKVQEQAGDYNAASEALAGFWQGVGERPNLEGLDDETQAHVLLRTGALTGWIGSAGQITGSQEAAKDLITESLRMFEALGQRNSVGEAHSDLARCYWREGAFDEARVTLQLALDEFSEPVIEQRITALLRLGEVERMSRRLSEALRIYQDLVPVMDEITDLFLVATFHHGFANVLNQLGSVENRKDYIDLALIEYAAASIHFEQAGHERFHACVENNLGFLFGTIGRFDEAHEHLDRAQMLMTRLKDNVHLAQVDETRARVLLAEGRNVEAEKTARSAVLRLERGDQLSLLAEALTSHGNALTRLGRTEQARAAFERAINVAEQAGDFESGGLAALALIEELGSGLSTESFCTTVDHARTLLEKSEDIGTVRRLMNAAFRALFLTRAIPIPPDWKDFSFRRSVFAYEGHLIEAALKEAGGSVTQAGRLLGFKHHQSLISLLNNRHKNLLEVRTKVKKRRHHLIDHSKRKN